MAIRFAARPAEFDPQREAMRLNASGTQHRRSGHYDEAVACHRQALEILRTLGDEQHEAQIMANLGFTHRRHGRREQGDNVLELALSKLSPASNAYHAIEAELRRAS
jgi:tetratricopeptide (TPR) repeat protein